MPSAARSPRTVTDHRREPRPRARQAHVGIEAVERPGAAAVEHHAELRRDGPDDAADELLLDVGQHAVEVDELGRVVPVQRAGHDVAERVAPGVVEGQAVVDEAASGAVEVGHTS